MSRMIKMTSFVCLCWLFLFMSLINFNEARSFVQVTSSSVGKSTLPTKNKKIEQLKIKQLPARNVDKVLSLRGGKLSDLDWRYFVAGGICAAFSHGITTPIDVVKTKMQTNPERFNQGVFHAAGDIIRNEGVGFLLAGLGPTVVGYGLEGALKFGFYETFKKIFEELKLTPFTVINYTLASIVAGAVASIALCPMEEARIKMVGEPSWSKENVLTAILRLIRENGVFATFSGLPAMLSKQVPYTMGKNVSFDYVKLLLVAILTYFRDDIGEFKWFISVGSAFLSSIVACLLSQPGDMILTSSYKGKTGKTFFQAIGDIYQAHGLAGFYFGTQARLAHVASIITTQLVFYDFINSLLGVKSSH